MRHTRIALIGVIAMSLAAVSFATNVVIVTNTNDSGAGSLRDAITQANATPADDLIRFAIGTGAVTLRPATPYPTTVGHIDIIGDSQPGFVGKPLIEIDASFLSAPAFHLTSASTLGFVIIHGDHAAAIEAGDSSIVGSCYIGTDSTGNTAIPNVVGVLVTGGGVRVIQNVISGNGTGIQVMPAAAGSSIYLNHIGPSASGTVAVPNGVGIDVVGNGIASGLEIGISGLANTISGNSGPAIRVTAFNAVTITDNYIGTVDYFGKPLGNGAGIELNGNNATIDDNVIENNSGTAIWIGGGTGNKITKNAISKNGFGIDLGNTPDGHTANDGLDGDSGPNGLQNHPIIASPIANLTSPTPTTTITGSLASAPNSTYSIELFANTNCGSGDYTAAGSYLTTLTVTTDSSGNATFSYLSDYLILGTGVAATATDAQNNTSEISNCSVVTRRGTFALSPIPMSAQETAGSMTVTIFRNDGTAGPVTVDYATTASTPQTGFYNAAPGQDYGAVSGTLTFADGETSKTITIPIYDDKMYETNEIFDITLSNPTGGSILDPLLFRNRAYIIDDETKTKISISDASVVEGNSGTTMAHVPVTLTPPAGFPVTITFSVGSGSSATEGEDFQPFSGSITFAPGEGSKTIDVPVFADTKYEIDEIFGITLHTATPENDVAFVNFGASCTILNDDVGKVSCTPSVSIQEGPPQIYTNVQITCTPDSRFLGGVHYVTVEGTAKASKQDYLFSSGEVFFNPGDGPLKFVVPVLGNDRVEPDKQFTINLTAEPAPPWNFVVEPKTITVTILNDDGVVTCSDIAVAEGNSGITNAVISCTSQSAITGTIDYTTHDGTAVAAGDYKAVSGTLTFNGETTKSIPLSIIGDTTIEPDEQFTIALTAHPAQSSPFSLAHDTAAVTIVNDDLPALVTCNDLNVGEGSGIKSAVITCNASKAITGTIDYATHDGTAAAGADYQTATGTLTFNGETTKSIPLSIFGDTTIEPDEQFTITLTAHPAQGSPFSLTHDTIVVTILNDDQPPPAPVVVLEPGRLAARVGEHIDVRASLQPPSETATTLAIIALDPSVVDVPAAAVVAPGQAAIIPVTAKKSGSTTITVSAAGGATTALLLIDVTEASPSLTSLDPAMGTVPGGATVSLHGTNLSPGCFVSFGGTRSTSAVFNGATAAIVVAPPHAEGVVDVTLTCGTSSSTLTKAFTYVPGRSRATKH